MTSIKKIPNVLGTRRSNALDQEREQFEKAQVMFVWVMWVSCGCGGGDRLRWTAVCYTARVAFTRHATGSLSYVLGLLSSMQML